MYLSKVDPEKIVREISKMGIKNGETVMIMLWEKNRPGGQPGRL
jgi:hypothetical protein